MGWTCGACGGDNPEGTRFCGHCGAPADAVPPPAQPSPSEPAPAEPRSDRDVAEALRSFVHGQVATKLLESGGAFAEERRLVTALFADISGFTSLADRLDPEHLMEVIDPIIETMTNIVGKYDGYIEKFGGDALLALFGAPTAHDDDALRALLVAQEMHAALPGLQRLLPADAPPLSLHIGVNSGHAVARVFGSDVRMDYAVLGDAIIVAQRLESAAPGGETYVGESTYELTRTKTGFEYVGELTLKGKSKPAKAWRLLGDRRKGIRSTKQAFVGRTRELTLAEELLDATAERRGGLLTVTGDPGVGKSRMLQEVRERAQARGFLWLEARCVSYGAGLAYWPLVEMTRRLAGIEAAADPKDALATVARGLSQLGADDALPYVARLLGLPLSEADALEPEAFKRGLHTMLTRLAGAVASQRPLLVALEDVHWIDASTAEAVAELTRSAATAGFGIYLSARPEGRPQIEGVAAQAPPGIRRDVELEALSDEALQELVQITLGATPPPELIDIVIDRSAGNPLFAEEIVRSLRDSEALERVDGTWKMRRGWDVEGVPLTIEGVLSGRIDVLPHGVAAILQLASVIGRRVSLPLLRAVAGDDFTQVGPSVERLLASGLMDGSEDDAETVTFHHALIQEVAYNRLLRKHRRSIHLKVAEAAERLYGDREDFVGLQARHLYLGGAGAKAVGFLMRAGERARRLFANEEAALHFERAAELAPDDPSTEPLMPEILVNLGDVQELRGNFDEALRAYQQALEYANDIRAWRGISSALRHKSDFDEGLRQIDEAFASLELAGAEAAVLWLERGWMLSLAGRYAEGSEALQAGLALAEAPDDPVRGQLLLQLGKNEAMEGRVEQGLEHVLEALEIARAADDLEGTMRAMRILGGIYGEVGRLEQSIDVLRAALPLAEKIGRADEIAGILLNLGMTHLDLGAVDEAITVTKRSAEEFERIQHGHGRAATHANLGDMLLQSGQYDEALEQCRIAHDLASRIKFPLVVADATLTMARIHAARGNHSEAAALADEAAALFDEMDAVPTADKARNLAEESRRRALEEAASP